MAQVEPATRGVESRHMLEGVQRFSRVFVVVFMAAILGFIAPGFLRPSNILNVLRQASMVAIIALGQTIVIISGGIDLSMGTVATFAGVVAAWLAKLLGWPVAISLLAGPAFGALVGLINGLMVAVAGLPPFVATYGTYWVVNGATLAILRGLTIFNLPPAFRAVGIGRVLGIPVPIFEFLALAALTWILLRRTIIGRAIYAVGANQAATEMSGIDARLAKIQAFVLSGFFAGVGGVVYAAYLNTAEEGLAEGTLLLAIASVVVGGTSMAGGEGSIASTAVGAIILALLANGMTLLNVHSSWQQPVQGIVILAAVFMDQWSRRALGGGGAEGGG